MSFSLAAAYKTNRCANNINNDNYYDYNKSRDNQTNSVNKYLL